MTPISLSMLTHTLTRPRIAPAAIALVSLGALAAALIAQYGFDLKPCVLCVYQRIPYVIALTLGIMGFFLARRTRMEWLFVLGAGVTFLAGAGIAAFHVGVEQHWWAGTSSCTAQELGMNLSLEELQRQLEQAKAFVTCDDIPWSLFGISMAGYNLLASLVLSVVFLLAAGRLRSGGAT